MKKFKLFALVIAAASLLMMSTEKSYSQVYQLPNGGFENWDGGSADEPTNWNSYPSANCTMTGLASLGCSTAKAKKHEKSTDAHSGNYSCKIYSVSVLGVVANGALTTGQMTLGSTSLTSTANYNYTKTSDADFRQPLNAKPDSIVFWAKVVNASNSSQACCHLYIHDDYNLKDPLASNSSGYESHIVGKVPSYNFSNNGSTWQRHSTPIIYDDVDCLSDDPQYILITFSTNVNAGGGSDGDALYIDDIEFIYNPIQHEISETACGSFTWNGQTYTQSGDYEQRFEGTPRDSVVTLHLTINPGPSREITETECGSFTWFGEEYTTSGDYYHTVPMEVGCDSLLTLHLTIKQPTTGTDVKEACESFTWIDGITYTESNNTATYTLENAEGCDSIVTLNLTIKQPTTATDVKEACESFTWIDGITYTESNNTATYTLENAEGCDSIVTLNLTIKHATTGTDVKEACESFTWIDGITYTESNNTATYTLENAEGCDSVVTLNLTIKHATSYTDVQEACDTYTWIDGITYTESNNTATFTLENAAGCDSVVTLNLTMGHSSAYTDTHVACGSFTWIDGITYTESNHTATFNTSIAGCESVATLDLTINQPTEATDVKEACDTYTWIDGITYTESNNTATFTLENVAGCDSVVTLNLTIKHATSYTDVQEACDTYTWIDGIAYTESNNTATFTLENVAGCDSIVTLNLTIYESVANEIEETANNSFDWNGEIYTTSGNYTQEFETVHGCDSVVTLHLTINTVSVENNIADQINIYPIPANTNITIECADMEMIKIISLTGQVMTLKENISDSVIEISTDEYKSGNYIIYIQTKDGQSIAKSISIIK